MVKVVDESCGKIVVEFRGRKVEISSWRWVPKDPQMLRMAKVLRVCFYGKGIVAPWDECEWYEAKYGDKLLCDVASCEYEKLCPKFARRKTPYIA